MYIFFESKHSQTRVQFTLQLLWWRACFQSYSPLNLLLFVNRKEVNCRTFGKRECRCAITLLCLCAGSRIKSPRQNPVGKNPTTKIRLDFFRGDFDGEDFIRLPCVPDWIKLHQLSRILASLDIMGDHIRPPPPVYPSLRWWCDGLGGLPFESHDAQRRQPLLTAIRVIRCFSSRLSVQLWTSVHYCLWVIWVNLL